MCKFFSCVTKGDGDIMYFDWKDRQKWLKGEIKEESPDSHTSIANFYGYKGNKEDKLNKYEYNPLTKKFTIDQINTKDDSAEVKVKLDVMNWSRVVKPLIIKPIVHPFKVKRKNKKPTKAEIELLKQWASVWDSVRASIWAYYSSFFNIKYKHDFSSCVKLWEAGLVPSYDDKTWRLHAGENVEIVYEITREKLLKGL